MYTFSNIPNNTHAKWWKDPCLRINVVHCFGLCLCVFYLGYDQSLLTGLQALPRWNAYFNNPSRITLGLYASAIFLPSIVTAFVGDWIAAKFGRKPAVLIGSVLIITGALLNGLAQNPGQFVGGRVILGSGGAITKVGAPALLHEIAHPRLRGTLGGIYYAVYYMGSGTSGLLCLAGFYMQSEWSWRFPCIFQIVGPIVVMSVVVMAPESPRFLVKNGKNDQARAVLDKYHANSATDDPLVEWEYQEIVAALEAENTMKKTSYIDFFRTSGNRKRLLVLCMLSVGTNWVGNGIISYYLAPVLRQVGITDSIKILGINVGLAFYNLALAMMAGFNVERWGRRPLFFASFIGMFCSYVFVMGFAAGFATTGQSSLGVAVIPFLFFFYGFYDIAMTPLPYHYTTEILPYNLRSKGLAIFTSVQNCANALNQFVNPIALDAIAWRYYAVYLGVLLVYILFTYYYIVETKGLSLEQITLVMDYPRREARKMATAVRQETRQQYEEGGDSVKVNSDEEQKGGATEHRERV